MAASERKEAIMCKLVTIGALLAALAVPAGAAGHGARVRHTRVQISCPQTVVILPGRNYGMCGNRYWIRDAQTGQFEAVFFWRLQHQNDQTDDRP